MNKSFNSWFGDSEEAQKLYAQESLIVNTSEDFLTLMEEMGVTKSKLSKLIGKSKSFVTQSLNGTRNLTLKTLADMAYVMGAKVVVKFEFEETQNKADTVSDKVFLQVVAKPTKNKVMNISKPTKLTTFQAQENIVYEEFKEAV
ncbi:MAG TPA: XRE family transcriptional regulator [Aeromonadales bacterium]|nr:XRE family transcriptional regulator [Aeromonadales bacterium]